jgi:predicted TIM-barrel fold metal-dependent hydrolase
MSQYTVIDADAHVIETEATWDYLEGDERRFRPNRVSGASDPNSEYWIVDGKVAGPPLSTRSDAFVEKAQAAHSRNVTTPTAARKLEDIDVRLAHMTELGVDVQVLYNSLWIASVTDRPDTQVALTRSWNRWLADIWKEGKGRLRWTCVLPTMVTDVAIEELRFAKEHGAVGICLQPFDAAGMFLEPSYYPIYEVAAELDMPVAIHVSNGDPVLYSKLRNRLELLRGMELITPTIAAGHGLMVSEVPTLFPTMRWAIVEGGASWIPFLMAHLNRVTGKHYTPEENPFRERNIYVTTLIGDDYKYIIDCVGEDQLMIGTDYGHTDPASELDAIYQFRNVDLPEQIRKKVLCDNPAAFYGIEATTTA